MLSLEMFMLVPGDHGHPREMPALGKTLEHLTGNMAWISM